MKHLKQYPLPECMHLVNKKPLATKLHILEVTLVRNLLPEYTLLLILKLVFQTFGYIDFPITLSHQKVLATKQKYCDSYLCYKMFEAFGYCDFPNTLGHQKVLATKMHLLKKYKY